MSNNNLNEQSLNDFLVTSSTSGQTRTLKVYNSGVTISSSRVFIKVADTSSGADTSGDSFVRFQVGTTTQFAMGLDISESTTTFRIVSGTNCTPSSYTTECVRYTVVSGTSSDDCRFPNTAQFSVQRSAEVSNVTGAGTYYKAQLDTERFDTQTAFDSTTNYYFVAPIAGKYIFVGGLNTMDDDSGTYTTQATRIRVNGTTDQIITTGNLQAAQSGSGSDALGQPVVDILDLAANDTVELGIIVSGGASDNVNVRGNSTASTLQQTWLEGVLFG